MGATELINELVGATKLVYLNECNQLVRIIINICATVHFMLSILLFFRKSRETKKEKTWGCCSAYSCGYWWRRGWCCCYVHLTRERRMSLLLRLDEDLRCASSGKFYLDLILHLDSISSCNQLTKLNWNYCTYNLSELPTVCYWSHLCWIKSGYILTC